jgi:glycosyltransferase involved in cell wall biosynthesis
MSGVVVHVLGTASLEGRSIAELAAAIARVVPRGGPTPELWFLLDSGPLLDRFTAEGFSTRFVGWDGGWRNPLGALRFLRLLLRHRVVLVHQHFGGRLPRLLAHLTGAKAVMHVHSRADEASGQIKGQLHVEWADAVIATSVAIAHAVVGPIPVVAYPFVPSRALSIGLHRCDSTTIVIGAARRLARLKGLGDLLDAVALLHSEFPNIRLEIAGTGPLRADLEQRTERLGIREQVRFLGWREDMANVLAGWDIAVVPSRDEGFGIAALEAMWAGLPVVATAVGGLPEVVLDRVTGLLVPAGEPTALAEALRELLRSPELRAGFGEAGRQHVENTFSLEKTAAIIDRVYCQVLGR